MKVENKLFSVPKNGFLASNPSFFDKFARIGAPQAGSEASPIRLNNITAEAFKALLTVLYPLYAHFKGYFEKFSTDFYSKRKASSYGEWLGTLDLATRWDLTDVRRPRLAILSQTYMLVDTRESCQKFI